MRPLFPGQQEEEEIYLVVREHWMVLLLRILAWGVFAGILVLVDWGINKYVPMLKMDPYTSWVNLIRSLYLLFLMLGLLMIWTIYYLNVQIITNLRIVDITQNSLISHTVSELHLSRVEDVTAESTGLFQTFLDYGNVYVQTAGEKERFTFSYVPNPASLEKLILDLYEQLPDEHKYAKAGTQK